MAGVQNALVVREPMALQLNAFDKMIRQMQAINIQNIQVIHENINQVANIDIPIVKVDKLKTKFSDLNSKISLVRKGVGELYEGIKKLDDVTLRNYKLDTLNDGSQSTQVLSGKIYTSANRSGVDYASSIEQISKLISSNRDTFKDNDEAIFFTELMNKVYAISGTDKAGQSNIDTQLNQVFASGVMDAASFQSLLRETPFLIDQMANRLGISVNEMKNLAQEGKITSNMLKNTMFASTNEINTKFQDVPKTFQSYVTQAFNKVDYHLQKIARQFNKLINSKGFQVIFQVILAVIDTVAFIIDMVMRGVNLIASAIEAIWPVIEGVLLTLLLYLTTIAVSILPKLLGQAMLLIPKLWAMVAPVLAQAGAWIVAHLPVIMMIAGITTIILLLKELSKRSGSTLQYVGQVFFIAGAIIQNIIATLERVFVAVVVNAWNLFATFANFIATCFQNPVQVVCKLFWGLADVIFNIVQKIADALDKIFGSNFGGQIQGFRNKMDNLIDEKFKNDESVEFVKKIDLDNYDYFTDIISFQEAYENGTKFGKGIDDKLDAFKNQWDAGLNINQIDEVLNIEDEVKVSSEDIASLRELAEQQYIQNYINNEPVVYVTTGDVHENADIDYLVRGVTRKVREEIDSSMEGVPV